MSEPRMPREHEVSQIIGFLDKNLRNGNDWSIAAEYPSVFARNNLGNIRIIEQDQKVVSHAAVKFIYVKNTYGIFKVAAIGSVVTDPLYRNQGFSQKIIQSCLDAADVEGADFAILWSDLYDFYRKLGFELAGTEVTLLVENSLPQENLNQLRFMKSNKVAPEALLRLFVQHTCSAVRTVEEIRRNLQIPNSQVYTVWGPQNDLLAYAVEGKGADLKGYIHEWGGPLNYLIPLIAHIRKEMSGSLTVIAPEHSQNLIRNLKDLGVGTVNGFLGMIKPVNYKNLFFKINRYARQLGIDDLVLEPRQNGFAVGRGQDIAIVPTPQELTRLVFGPVNKETLSADFQKLFPIPMWIWGWDSV